MQIWPILTALGVPTLLTAGLVAVVALLRWTPPGRRFWERVLTSGAVNIRFRLRALRRYRNEVLRVDGEVPLPFAAPGVQPVNLAQIYVGRLVEAEPALNRSGKATRDPSSDSMERRLSVSDRQKATVITGEPGSGKSLLLQALVYGWANRFHHGGTGPIPVRISLPDLRPELRPEKAHPLDEDDELYPLHRLIARSFNLRGVPHAMRFVRQGLRHGRLWLLCDGLDEVSKTNEEEVRRLLGEARERYPRCQVTATCRAAVYRERLPGFETLALSGFSDANVNQFLMRWAERPDGSAQQVQRLRADLDEGGGRMKQLAESPLLLTYMANVYGHVGDDRPLPGSRARFFEEVVDFLLTHKAGDEFSAESKYVALQRLALRAMSVERQVLGYEEVIAEVKAALPQAGLPEDCATALLREIVHRTGLLRKLHARNEYQFAHLNLQEFFAATTFGGNSTELLSHQRSDPDAWREVVRLWCAQTSADLSPIIDALATSDMPLALECLAESDGDYIPTWLTERVLATFRISGSDGESTNDTIPYERAVSQLAADSGPLGARVRDLLMDIADTEIADKEFTGNLRAMMMLAESGHPEAVEFLMRRRRQAPRWTRDMYQLSRAEYAFQMAGGGAAVEALWRLYVPPGHTPPGGSVSVTEYGYPETEFEPELVNDIAVIKSPLALSRLTEFLSDPRREVHACAALHLARLVEDPENEAILRQINFAEEPESDLPWRPFEAGCSPDFIRLMNRVAAILVALDPHDVKDLINFAYVLIDTRIAVFVVAKLAMAGVSLTETTPVDEELWGPRPRFPAAVSLRAMSDSLDAAADTGVRKSVQRSHARWPSKSANPSHSLDCETIKELMTAKESPLPASKPSEEWHRRLLLRLSEAASSGVLTMVVTRGFHSMEGDWKPISATDIDAKPALRPHHLRWLIPGVVSVCCVLMFLTAASGPSRLTSWFPVFACAVAAAGLLDAIADTPMQHMAVMNLYIPVAGMAVGYFGWLQVVGWVGETLAWTWAIAGWLAMTSMAAMVVTTQDSLYKRWYWWVTLLVSLPWAGIVLYRAVNDPGDVPWVSGLAVTGVLTVLLCWLEGTSRSIVWHRCSVVLYLPVVALSWFGFENLFGPVTATVISGGVYAATASVLIVLDRHLLTRENPLRDILVELTKRNERVSEGRARHFGDWSHPDVADKFKLHSPAS